MAESAAVRHGRLGTHLKVDGYRKKNDRKDTPHTVS